MSVTISGAAFVRADRHVVWAALHDVNIISLCIPGCLSLVRSSDRAFILALQVRLGPIRLAFDGTVEITESDPPARYRLVGQGSGAQAGEALGTATITLAEQADGCTLTFDVNAVTRGPMSLLGSRVLIGVGNAIASVFASRLSKALADARTPANTAPWSGINPLRHVEDSARNRTCRSARRSPATDLG